MLPEFSQFNRWSKALEAMWVLAFMGEPADMDFEYEQLSALNFWQKVGMPQPKPEPKPQPQPSYPNLRSNLHPHPNQVDMSVFVGTYFFYVLMSIILLLNLLIAMMGHTFDDVFEKAALETNPNPNPNPNPSPNPNPNPNGQASSRRTSSGVLLLGGTRLRPTEWKEPYGWLRLAESAYAGAGAAVLPPPPGAADSWSAFDARFELRIWGSALLHGMSFCFGELPEQAWAQP